MATLSDLRTIARDSFFHDKTDSKSTRVIDRTVNSALRLLAESHDWEYYNTEGRINTVPQQSSGTVAVTQAASTVTLTGATWPSGLTDYYIRINSSDVDYSFSSRDGDTTATFSTGQVWLDTTQTTATYSLYQSRYDLPTDCRKFGQFNVQDFDWSPTYVSKEVFLQEKTRDISFNGDPVWISHDNTYAYLWPPPAERKALPFNYQRWPASVSTGTDTIDWDSNRLDLLYGAMGLMIDVHQRKMTYPQAIGAVRQTAYLMSSDEPKRSARTCVRSMYSDPSFTPFNRLDYEGS